MWAPSDDPIGAALRAGPTLADRLASGEADEREWDPESWEPQEGNPPDGFDGDGSAGAAGIDEDMAAELAREALEEAGMSGPALVSAARSAIQVSGGAMAAEDPSLMTDAELIGQAAALRSLAARAAGRQYWLLAEMLRRRPYDGKRKAPRREAQARARDETEGIGADAPAARQIPEAATDAAADEFAMAFTLTGYGAETLAMTTADLATRLPRAAVQARLGVLDDARVKILWEYTRDLPSDCAIIMDALLSESAHQMTTGKLREKARELQIKIDPGAAEKRRKRGERTAKVALYANDDHTGTLAFEHVPAVQAAAAKARIAAIARAMKAAAGDEDEGEPDDSLTLLQAKVGLGLLTGTLPYIPPAQPPDGAAGPEEGPGPHGGLEPRDGGTGPDEGPGSGSESNAGSEADTHAAAGASPWPKVPSTATAAAPGCVPIPPACRPKDAGRLRLQAPWRTLAGMAGLPGDLSAFGIITPGQARELATAAARDPACAWRVLVTDDNGRAIALTGLRRCGAENTDERTPGLISEVTVTIQESLALGLDTDDDWRDTARRLATVDDPALTAKLREAVTAASKAATEARFQEILDADAGGCAHAAETSGYRIPPRLRRWVQARDRTCRNPVCGRRAFQCDLDHTIPYDKGGRTCSCDLGAVCRHCHRLKQSAGWHLKQEPGGIFTWVTPAGLVYRKEPDQYLV
jgi:hypothetical protein